MGRCVVMEEPRVGQPGSVPARDETGVADGASGTSAAGHLEVRCVSGRSVTTRSQATAPLKLLTPRRRGGAAWIYLSTFGGGLVAGDRVQLYADIHPDSVAVLTTQAATKVFHQQEGMGAQQSLHATVAQGATLVVAPDPLTCFADAVYEQRQTFDLVGDASLVLLDWVTCGRAARGERWTFDRYDSRNRIRRDGKEIVFDRLRLDAALHPPADAFAAGPFDVLATLYLVGPAAEEGIAEAEAWVADLQGDDDLRVQASFSRHDWGAVLRVMGVRTQRVSTVLKKRLNFLESTLGMGVWSRRA